MSILKRDKQVSAGQSFAEAFAEQGVSFPSVEPEAPAPPRTKTLASASPLASTGSFRPGFGWQAVSTPRGRVYRATTDQIGGVFPFLTSTQLPKSGAALGYVASTGTGFYVDPWQWVQRGIVTNPNLLLQGAPRARQVRDGQRRSCVECCVTADGPSCPET
ncbi:hypothetical protein FV141_14360 (plasmid) [Dermacoccus abyssi]|uniref:Uncharacterized protein n=1 Tax=Dermacoccus abyssi TaxID=322596 RepID=A0ABX5ZDX2_9MICO|nr:hypothetical protein FV141_14360 [Dermacoccus abyssi]